VQTPQQLAAFRSFYEGHISPGTGCPITFCDDSVESFDSSTGWLCTIANHVELSKLVPPFNSVVWLNAPEGLSDVLSAWNGVQSVYWCYAYTVQQNVWLLESFMQQVPDG